MILAIGLGLPAATIYFFGGGARLLAAPSAEPLALFGRLIQLAFIVTASLLPVLLFFLFDRFQLGTLRRRLYTNLFRLDRSVTTIGAINAKYGSQIAEAYGAEDQGRGRLAPGSRWPVLVCAIVITIGWIVALAPVGDFAPQDRQAALGVLLPEPTALVFGFLGVYFFSLRLIAIRYARGDLKPKAYSHIMVRVLIVVVLCWVLDAIFAADLAVKLVLAFLFGITPDEFFTWLKEAFRDAVPESIVPRSTRLPLTDLEGIDLYDLGRLESEGIVNIEGLAHHELFDLIIETRIPVAAPDRLGRPGDPSSPPCGRHGQRRARDAARLRDPHRDRSSSGLERRRETRQASARSVPQAARRRAGALSSRPDPRCPARRRMDADGAMLAGRRRPRADHGGCLAVRPSRGWSAGPTGSLRSNATALP